VGKTFVSAVLVEALKADYWKPIQTGSITSTDSVKLKELVSNTRSVIHPESFCLKEPISPHAAAKMESVSIELSNIHLPAGSNTIIIEGAGGLMVPLNDKEFMIDLIKKLDAEVVLVIRNYLGSINHSLLSIDELKFRKLNVLGLIFNGPGDTASEDIILKYSGLRCLGRINQEIDINRATVLKYVHDFESLLK